MFWLFTQMFVLCVVSFAAGSALTWWAQRNRAQPETPKVTLALPAPRPAADQPAPVVPAPAAPASVVTPPVVPAPAVNAMQLKGNSKTMVYHTPDSPYYRRMKGDMTFTSEEEAVAAGYRMWTTKARAKA